jgi:Raf kinase inhibitor-like YbhB/YbcL family protein
VAQDAACVVPVIAMRRTLPSIAILAATLAAPLAAQTPAAPAARPPQAQGARRTVQAMTLGSTAWPDGGVIPVAHTQAGDETSPPLAWSGVPEGVQSFVLLVHDVDAATGDGTDDVLHWLVWNLPGDVRALPAGVPAGNTVASLGDARQISATGPGYRGPGALAAGPVHHYVFELFALDVPIAVPAGGASPQATRTAVMDAMKGHVRGKGAYTGLFRRAP